jgi:orotate phosphoribosyltransferase
MTLHEREVDPEPEALVIVDDVLATGSHFRAAKKIVRKKWPHMRVIGVFLARACWRRPLVMREPPQLQPVNFAVDNHFRTHARSPR